MKTEILKFRAPVIIYRIALVLEIAVSILVVLGIATSLFTVALELGVMIGDPGDTDGLRTFLATAFTVVIGIEFLKMLARHNMSTAIEVLLFAIARQMVIEHTTAFENLTMVAAIAILFAIRKFLFIPGLDDKQSMLENRIYGEPQEKQEKSNR